MAWWALCHIGLNAGLGGCFSHATKSEFLVTRPGKLAIVLLSTDLSYFKNHVDPDPLASLEAN